MDNTPAIKIVLADDHAVLRQGLRSLLGKKPEYDVVAEASDGVEAIRLVRETLPSLLIIDLTMPHLNGMDAIRDIKKIHPHTKIIVFTVHTAEEYVFASLKAGADGYVPKTAKFAELVAAIQTVLQGKIYLSPDISNTVVEGYLKGASDRKAEDCMGSLTSREYEVLKLVAEGYKNREIADTLYISVKTVEKHRENIKHKLGLSGTSAMITYAIQHGLVSS